MPAQFAFDSTSSAQDCGKLSKFKRCSLDGTEAVTLGILTFYGHLYGIYLFFRNIFMQVFFSFPFSSLGAECRIIKKLNLCPGNLYLNLNFKRSLWISLQKDLEEKLAEIERRRLVSRFVEKPTRT